jgi:hypothetical protein
MGQVSLWNVGMMEEWNAKRSFPQCGKLFSIAWKNPPKVFHSVEKMAGTFPCRGKCFSMA